MSEMMDKLAQLDIDRLHKVYLGICDGRRCGKTTLFATHLIGLSWLNDYQFTTLHVLFHWVRSADHTFRVLEETCLMMGVNYNIERRYVMRVNNTLFVFCHDEPMNRIGRDNTVFGEDN